MDKPAKKEGLQHAYRSPLDPGGAGRVKMEPSGRGLDSLLLDYSHLDFAALEQAGRIHFTEAQREIIAAAVVFVRETNANAPTSKELLRKVDSAIGAAKQLIDFQDFMLRFAGSQFALDLVTGDNEMRAAIVLGVKRIQSWKRKLSELVSNLKELPSIWKSRPIPRCRFENELLLLIDPIFRVAGGTGPYPNKMYDPEYENDEQYLGDQAFDFYEELFRQLGSDHYKTRSGLAQAILKARRRVKHIPPQLAKLDKLQLD